MITQSLFLCSNKGYLLLSRDFNIKKQSKKFSDGVDTDIHSSRIYSDPQTSGQ